LNVEPQQEKVESDSELTHRPQVNGTAARDQRNEHQSDKNESYRSLSGLQLRLRIRLILWAR
jgi:hypothetical protein